MSYDLRVCFVYGLSQTTNLAIENVLISRFRTLKYMVICDLYEKHHDTTIINVLALQEEDVLDDPNEMPDEPRFSSQLSEEAQYAMLRGYQDKIQDELTSKSLR